VLALFFNFLALYLIITRSRKAIGSYKYLLIAFLCNDVVFSVVHQLCQPVLSFRGGFFVSYGEGLVDSSFVLTLYGAAGSLAFPLLAYHFMYRAYVVSRHCSPRLQNWRHSRKVAVLLGAFLLLEAGVWVFFNYQLRLDPSDGRIRATIAAAHPNLANRTELIAIVPFINDELNVRVAWAACPLLAIAGSSFVCIIAAAFKITYALYIHTTTSLSSIAIHKRMFIALIIQMLVPTLTMIAPSMAAISLPFLPRVSIDIPDWLIGTCYSLYPLLDPIVITLCIRDYRWGLYQLLR
ncbi:hypothetical protein PENTCL1PPCAC_14282, partial [Pristionchus entomophagus]